MATTATATTTPTTEKINSYTIEVDGDVCVGCGACVGVCGFGVLELRDGSAVLAHGERCIGCTQCTAVCPTRAVHAVVRDPAQTAPVPADDFVERPFVPLEALAQHVAARRSVRHFAPEPPPRAVLERVLQAARYAPTARNRRTVHYAVVADPARVQRLRELCAPACAAPHLLMPAPCVLLVLSTSPRPEDALIAATTVDLLAPAAGLACTFAGIVRRCVEGSPDVRRFLRDECGITGIEDGCLQALNIGIPASEPQWLRPAVREPAPIQWS